MSYEVASYSGMTLAIINVNNNVQMITLKLISAFHVQLQPQLQYLFYWLV